MAISSTTQNDVAFFLDGSQFFPAVDQAIQAVIASPPNPLTYVRMAFWMASHDMPLVDPFTQVVTVHDILETRLREAAWTGHAVDLILYRPSEIDLKGEWALGGDMATGLFEANQTTHEFLDRWTSTYDGNAGTIRVYLEKLDRWAPAASNHQKLVICSIAGQRTVFLGGFNLLASYWDTPAHGYPGHTWHDTGVRLRGPSTDAVEAEWMRRWRKSGHQAVNNTTPQNTYGPVNGQTVGVRIATTSSEGWRREPDIQRELVSLIAGAKVYLYFENYGFTDPTLVDALAARIRAAASAAPPAMIVNLAWPKPPLPFPAMVPYDYLDYVSWMKLALQGCTSVDVPDPAHPGGPPVEVPRATATVWRIRESWNVWSTARSVTATFRNRWLEEDALEWQLPGGGVQATRLTDIVAVTGGLRFFTTARASSSAILEPVYLHSKLALFDDRYAVVGTANFTYRSMVYDGEIVAIVDNPGVVTQIRQQLLPHFNTGGGPPLTPANFATVAAANRVLYTNHSLAGGNLLYVLPLEMGDYSRVPPQDWKNFTVY
jgi:phosphatidylserine/phosphatidylglycerophosphate/cardiolipin synthase-like enzyme